MATEASQGSDLSRPAMMGIASGIFFMTFFGATLILWLTALIVSWQGLIVMLADSPQ